MVDRTVIRVSMILFSTNACDIVPGPGPIAVHEDAEATSGGDYCRAWRDALKEHRAW
jgi:hypothetical protein